MNALTFCGLILQLGNVICCLDSSLFQEDSYMTHHTFRRMYTYSVIECVARCQMSSVCKSISFHKTSRMCHLHDDNSDAASIEVRVDYIYSNISLWSKSYAGRCAETTCPVNSSCFVDRHHRPKCRPEFAGCGEPPEVEDAQKEYDGHYVSALTTYTCLEDFMICGKNTGQSVCRATGQWYDLGNLCRQYRWYGPLPPYYTGFQLPCGPSDSFQVELVAPMAQLSDEDEQAVSLWGGNDILFKLHFCYKNNQHGNETYAISRISDAWEGYTPLWDSIMAPGQVFLLDISLDNGVYSVNIDGEYYADYNERKVGAKVERIQLQKYVSVSRVEFYV